MRLQIVSVCYRRIACLPPLDQFTCFRTENSVQSFFDCLLRGLAGLLRFPWSMVEDIGNERS